MHTTAACRAAGASLLLLVLAGCGPRPTGPIRIGVSAPLTDSSAASLLRAANLAAAEINAAGGVDGRPLDLMLQDDRGTPNGALEVATRFYDSDVLAVVGSIGSGPALSAAPIYNGGSRPLVQLLPSASATGLSEAGPFTFRLCATDQAYGALLARYARTRLGARRAAVLYVNDEEGRGLRAAFTREFVLLGGDPPPAYPFTEGRPDVASYLKLLARHPRPEVLLLAAAQGDGAALIRAARLALPGVSLLAGNGMAGIEAQDSTSEGVYLAAGYLVWSLDSANRSFVRAYRSAYPGAGLPDQRAAATYDGVHLLAAAMAGGHLDRAALRQALAGATYMGAIGPIRFDSGGDIAEPRARVGLVRAGRPVPVD